MRREGFDHKYPLLIAKQSASFWCIMENRKVKEMVMELGIATDRHLKQWEKENKNTRNKPESAFMNKKSIITLDKP